MNGLTDDLEFERELQEAAEDPLKLNMFVARKVHTMSQNCTRQCGRIDKLEAWRNRTIAITGTAATIVGGVIVAVIDYLRR